MGQCCGKKTAPVEGDGGAIEGGADARSNRDDAAGYGEPQGDAAEGAGP